MATWKLLWQADLWKTETTLMLSQPNTRPSFRTHSASQYHIGFACQLWNKNNFLTSSLKPSCFWQVWLHLFFNIRLFLNIRLFICSVLKFGSLLLSAQGSQGSLAGQGQQRCLSDRALALSIWAVWPVRPKSRYHSAVALRPLIQVIQCVLQRTR